jgi:hypothetical protein
MSFAQAAAEGRPGDNLKVIVAAKIRADALAPRLFT